VSEKEKKLTPEAEAMENLTEFDMDGMTEEEMEAVSGGDHFTGIIKGEELEKFDGHCNGWSEGYHEWQYTGHKRPGRFFGDLWPDYLHRCIHCLRYMWIGSKRQ